MMQHIPIVKTQQRELFQIELNLARNCGYNEYQRALASMIS